MNTKGNSLKSINFSLLMHVDAGLIKVLNKQCFFYLTAMIICFARCYDFKVIPFNVMSGDSDMVSNS